MMIKTPILFLIFKRPKETQLVFNQIKKVKPQKLFIAADGPRKHIENEYELCLKTRQITQQINWPCEIKTLFREKNLGLKTAVSQAISWFFEHVDQGVILEDDCIPSQSFFHYCQQLLNHYKNNEKIMHISGENPLNKQIGTSSYYFSPIEHCWGWATWKRAWKHFDINMKSYPNFKQKNTLSEHFSHETYKNFWLHIFDNVYTGKVNSWAFIWTYTIFLNKGLCINSNTNMIQNIGFGQNATHTTNKNSTVLNRKAHNLTTHIIHPPKIILKQKVIDKIYKKRFGIHKETKLRALFDKTKPILKKTIFFKIYKITKKTFNQKNSFHS